MKKMTITVAAIAVAATASSASAAIYDEAIDGDLGRLSSPTTFDVQLGTTSVIGTVGDALQIVAFEQGEISKPRRAIVQRLCAIRSDEPACLDDSTKI